MLVYKICWLYVYFKENVQLMYGIFSFPAKYWICTLKRYHIHVCVYTIRHSTTKSQLFKQPFPKVGYIGLLFLQVRKYPRILAYKS
jgi:hypothetical protein